MFFYLHYILMTSGLSGTCVLLAVYFKTYSDASQAEVGALLMAFPFVGILVKPLFCSMADRHLAHRRYLAWAIVIEMLGYAPFAVVPFFPQFYTHHPRASWLLLAISCIVGNGALGVAWSLGDCLAVNKSQKSGTPFGYYRMMGTASWGVYGFIIGQINEMPALPKYLPSFIILHLSLALELAMIVCWDKEEFELIDPLQAERVKNGSPPPPPEKPQQALALAGGNLEAGGKLEELKRDYLVDSSPCSSSTGSLKMNSRTARVLRDMFSNEELHTRLTGTRGVYRKSIDCDQQLDLGSLQPHSPPTAATKKSQRLSLVSTSGGGGGGKSKNPQLLLLRMIFANDGRVLKYIVLFTLFGFIMAPMNFLFLSMEEVCHEKGYNFSQLAGSVLISQASIETLCFLVAPVVLRYISNWHALSFGLSLMVARFLFYAGWYYTSDISPYWTVIGEWSHGISYGIFASIQADVALMFANQSGRFIPELRRRGYLSAPDTVGVDGQLVSKEQIEAEETSTRMALRATMQALFSAFMDGFGSGVGSLICGVFIELYSYVSLWKLFFVVSLSSFLMHLVIELTRSRYSDHLYEPSRKRDDGGGNREKELDSKKLKKKLDCLANGGGGQLTKGDLAACEGAFGKPLDNANNCDNCHKMAPCC